MHAPPAASRNFTTFTTKSLMNTTHTPTDAEMKEIVRQKYTEIAKQDKAQNESSCCGSGCCSTEVATIMSDDYSTLEGYTPEADLGLGCGLPTEFAQIKPGDTVVDLGSGAGNDAFVARAATGESGKVIGIDFTEAMIEKARENAEARGFNNVEFRMGDIEHMPLGPNRADVIVSNCVLNLVPNKAGVISEIYRVLKSGGHFSISDVVLVGELPDALRHDAEMYAGCVSGAIQKSEYLSLIAKTGFINVTIQKDKAITIPQDILRNYLSPADIKSFNHGASGIYSVTVYAEKPVVAKACGCNDGCC
jgi:SAM-dependent methyltransferase